MKQIVVTAGVIQDRQGRTLITQRRPDTHAGLLWEFPGGRLEPGEKPEDGLRRELYEELRIGVGDLHLFDVVSHVYDDAELHVVLLVYRGILAEGSPKTVECADFAWVWPAELAQYAFSAADVPIVQRLLNQG